MTALRKAPHRANPAPPAKPWATRLELAWLEAQQIGVEQTTRTDLERWRSTLTPSQFKRLCNRLDRAISAAVDNRARSAWSDIELPFPTKEHQP